MNHRLVPRAIFMSMLLVVLAMSSCGEAEPATEQVTVQTSDQSPTPAVDESAADRNPTLELFPDVLEATAVRDANGTWTFSATLSSPYDTPARYADGWRIVGPDGEVYGVRLLTHDHQSEQPFTRSQSGIEIPEEIMVVTIEGRDQVSGWGGATVELELTR